MKRVHKALKLRHHKHTGKILAHKHTSYRALFPLVLVPMFMMALVGHMDAVASDISVTATVPAPIPGGAPTIEYPTEGITVNTQNITVSGTCPITAPAIIVAIYDNSNFAGSSACAADGTYSVQMSATVGTNVLVATVKTFTGGTGASSAPLSFTRSAPPTPPPAPSPSPSSAPSASPAPKPTPNVETPPETVKEVEEFKPVVRIIPEEAFVSIKSDGRVTWRGSVKGGTQPYKIRADWGDGTVEERRVHDHSIQTFTHVYKTQRAYALLIKATDVNGVTTILQSAAVTPTVYQGATTDKAKYQSIPPVVVFIDKYAPYIWIGLLSSLVFLWWLEHGRKAWRNRHIGRPLHR